MLTEPGEADLDRGLQGEEVRQQIRRMLRTLDTRERLLIRLRFGLGDSQGHTLSEIGTRLGLTRERVRQIEKAAMLKMALAAGRKPR
jgi:RNA polymerase sigma factor (sigma-70 family)